ncbi:MAG: ArnT family glycosyltransferase [Chitinophagaceae bacterium]
MQINYKIFFKEISLSTWFKGLIILSIIPNMLGLFPTLMDQDDNTLYANIAKTIVDKNDWINLYVNGKDWLDKPHFQFWITAIFYKIFGFNQFAYKIFFLFYFLSWD